MTKIKDEQGEDQGGIKEIVITVRPGELYADVTMIGYVSNTQDAVKDMLETTNSLDIDLRDVVVRSVNVETAFDSDWDDPQKEKKLRL